VCACLSPGLTNHLPGRTDAGLTLLRNTDATRQLLDAWAAAMAGTQHPVEALAFNELILQGWTTPATTLLAERGSGQQHPQLPVAAPGQQPRSTLAPTGRATAPQAVPTAADTRSSLGRKGGPQLAQAASLAAGGGGSSSSSSSVADQQAEIMAGGSKGNSKQAGQAAPQLEPQPGEQVHLQPGAQPAQAPSRQPAARRGGEPDLASSQQAHAQQPGSHPALQPASLADTLVERRQQPQPQQTGPPSNGASGDSSQSEASLADRSVVEAALKAAASGTGEQGCCTVVGTCQDVSCPSTAAVPRPCRRAGCKLPLMCASLCWTCRAVPCLQVASSTSRQHPLVQRQTMLRAACRQETWQQNLPSACAAGFRNLISAVLPAAAPAFCDSVATR